MSNSVELGNLSTAFGAPRMFGTSSQLDTAALVQSLVEARRIPAMRLEQRITENEARAAAFGDLKALLGNLRNAANSLRNPPGFLGAQDNVFEKKAAFFTSNTATAPEQLLGVNVTNEAQTGRFDVVVHQLATARKLSADSVADPTAALAASANGGNPFAGSFTIGLEGGDQVSVDVHGDMTLNELRARINAVSDQSGVRAQVIKVADGDHRLILTAEQTGKEVQLAGAGGDDVQGILGLSEDGGASFKNPLQDPKLAEFEIDGVMLTRTSNTVGDAIQGVTLSLTGADPGTTVSVEIERSLGDVKERIYEFVEAYNTLRSFAAEQQKVSRDGELGEGAVLFANSTLRSVLRGVDSQIGGAVQGLDPDAVATLRGLGITLDQQNRLKIDEGKLDQMLLNDVDSVRGVFEFGFSSSDGSLTVLKRSNALAESQFTVNIVDTAGDGQIEAADIDGIPVDFDGKIIRGQAGTPFEGLELFWSGTGSTSIDVTATQGIAERLYNQLGPVLQPVSGVVDQELQNIERANDRWSTQIERIEQRVEDYREQLIRRFAAMEQALAMADAMMRQMRTQMDAMFKKD